MMTVSNGRRIAALVVVVLLAGAGLLVLLYPHQTDVSYEGSGSVTPDEGTGSVLFPFTFDAVPDDGWEVSDVHIHGGSVSVDGDTVTVSPDPLFFDTIRVHVVFSETDVPEPPVVTHTVTVTHTSGGNVSPSGTVTVTDGGSLVLTIVPDSGYRVSSVTDGGTAVSASGTYTVSDITGDREVHVVFSKIEPVTPPYIPPYNPPSPPSPPAEDPVLSSISVTTWPTKVTYNAGERFDPTGMVVTATYGDNSTENVTSSCNFTPAAFAEKGMQTVTVSYTEGGVTKICTLSVTVTDGAGFSVKVVSYSGQRNENGTVKDFDETKNVDLKNFTLNTSGMVPGMTQKLTLSVINDSGHELDAYLYVTDVTGDQELREVFTITAVSGQTTVSKTVSEISADGKFLSLGTVGADPLIIEVTLTFPSTAGNSTMGKTLNFGLGVFAAQAVGA